MTTLTTSPASSPETLTLPEYWDQYKLSIANVRKWKNTGGHCPTLIDYNSKVKKLVLYSPVLSKRSICELSYMDLFQAINRVRPHGQGNKPYSNSTMQNFFSLLNDIFTYAENHFHAVNVLHWYRPGQQKLCEQQIDLNNLLMTHNRSASLMLIRAEIQQRPYLRRSLSNREMTKLRRKIINGLTADGRYMALAIALYTGVRSSECRAIKWSDIHEIIGHNDCYYFSLHGTLDSNGKEQSRMKTANAYRKIPIHTELLMLLKQRWEYINSSIDISSSMPKYICCPGNDFLEPCTQAQLSIFAKKMLSSIIDDDTLLMNMLANLEEDLSSGQESSPHESMTMRVLRRNFRTWLQSQTEMENMEKHYVMGHKMLDNGVDIRPSFNNEDAIWQLGQKMNQFGIDPEAHRSSVTFNLSVANPAAAKADAGIINVSVPDKGGILHLHLISHDASDEIRISAQHLSATIEGRFILADMPTQMTGSSPINLEYDNWRAFQVASKRLMKEQNTP